MQAAERGLQVLILFGVEVGDLQVLRGIRERDSVQDHWLPPGPKPPLPQVRCVCVCLSVCEEFVGNQESDSQGVVTCAVISRFERLRKPGLVYPVGKKRASEMVQWLQPPAAKSDDPSSSLRTHVVEGDS